MGRNCRDAQIEHVIPKEAQSVDWKEEGEEEEETGEEAGEEEEEPEEEEEEEEEEPKEDEEKVILRKAKAQVGICRENEL